MAEAIIIILRFVDDKWGIEQRVIRLMLVAKSVKLASEIISTLATQLQIQHHQLVASMRDHLQ